MTRFQHGISNREEQILAVKRLLRHEVGHMLGLVERDHHVEDKLGLHCTNICTMRQGLSVPEWLQQAKEEEKHGVQFCSCCMNDLSRNALKIRSL